MTCTTPALQYMSLRFRFATGAHVSGPTAHASPSAGRRRAWPPSVLPSEQNSFHHLRFQKMPTEDTRKANTDSPFARDDGPQSEDRDTSPGYQPLAVEFAPGAD